MTPISTRLSYLLLASSTATVGCSVEKFLADDELLYDGSEITFTEDSTLPNETTLRTRLESQVQQEAASDFGMWWWYRLEHPDSAKGFKPWLRRTLGAEPEFYDDIQSDRTEALMVDYLKDHGYFGAELERDTVHPDRNHVVVQYELAIPGRAKIAEVAWPRDTLGEFGEFLQDVQPGVFVREGEYYTVAGLSAERQRIDALSARRGFFEFASNNIYYVVDSAASPAAAGEMPGVGVYMRLDGGEDSLTFSRFDIGKTYIYPDYSPALADDAVTRDDTTWVRPSTAVIRRAGTDTRIKSATVARRVGLRPGDTYDRQIYDNTVNQLLDLGVFSYVNYTLERQDTDTVPQLDQYIYLTQGPSQTFTASLEGTTQVGNIPGFNATVSYANTNLFGGAEDFSASLSAGAGLQSEIGDIEETVLARQYGAQTEIAIPRFVGPFAEAVERNTLYIPRTVAELRYQLTDRPEFGLQNVNLRLGYRAQLNRRTSASLYPVSVAYTNLLSPSDTFATFLEASPRLAQSFVSNAIVAIEGDFRYSSLAPDPLASQWNIEVGAKSAGLLLNEVFLGGSESVGDNEVFGVAAAQYIRGHVDARYTKPFDGFTLATRAYAGAGIPYGNSNTVPFVDQFFVGGPNSMRGFRLRGIGPGAAVPPGVTVGEDVDAPVEPEVTNFNQTGDIRLEGNVEVRFPVFDPYLKGAVFMDVGNVWLYSDVGREAPDGLFGQIGTEDGGVTDFALETLLDQFAASLGAGLRVDIEFLVLRFDFAVPVRKPYLQDPSWDFSALNIIDDENRDDLRFQFGIGYPF